MRKFGTPRFLPDKEIVHRLVIPAGGTLAGAVFFPCLKPVGAYILKAKAADLRMRGNRVLH
jgi:hypothetical protein